MKRKEKTQKPTRVFLDTNILFAAILFPRSIAARALDMAASPRYELFLSDYVLGELRRIFTEKFPGELWRIDVFLENIRHRVETVDTPDKPVSQERVVRDDNDWPVVRAAVAVAADILLSCDKDLLEADFDSPRVMDAKEFLKYCGEN